jgi:hypothetical protein
LRSENRAVGLRLLEELLVVVVGGDVALQQDVRVRIDQPRQTGLAAQVDLRRVDGRLRRFAVAHFGDPLAADQKRDVPARRRALPVDQRSTVDRDRRRRLRRRVLRDGRDRNQQDEERRQESLHHRGLTA